MLILESPVDREAQRRRRNMEIRVRRMKAAKARGTHTAQEWAAMLEFCGNKCCKCGLPPEQGNQLVKDHITPLYEETEDASDGIDNIQPLHDKCNVGKHSDMTDYRPQGWADFISEKCGKVPIEE